MKVTACSIASAARSVRRMAGTKPYLFPPYNYSTFAPELLEGADLVMLKLHGNKGQGRWFGDNWTVALRERDVLALPLDGVGVFAENCWLPEGPMLRALLAAGAAYVIGGEGVNYGGIKSMGGADVLGLFFRWLLKAGMEPQYALHWAKMRLMLKWRTLATRDTLAFKMYVGEQK